VSSLLSTVTNDVDDHRRSQNETIRSSQTMAEPLPSKTPADGSDNVFNDETSKLTFREKMTLFNLSTNHNGTRSSSLKHNRNRLTQVKVVHEHLTDRCLVFVYSRSQLKKYKQQSI
jgi:hypothetical protein